MGPTRRLRNGCEAAYFFRAAATAACIVSSGCKPDSTLSPMTQVGVPDMPSGAAIATEAILERAAVAE